MARSDGRGARDLRPVETVVGFQRNAEGSVLYRAGRTVVLCTASVDPTVPAFLLGSGKGWITAEYQMHPRSAPERRESRDGRGKAPSGRTQEIQRLIGRALRAAVDLESLGERQIVVDCDVLEADGGTRTASITGGFIALAIALDKLKKNGKLDRPVIREQVAATSVGFLTSGLALDLVYVEDSKAQVDLNLVGTERGNVVEVQGTAEGEAIPRKELDDMVNLAMDGVIELTKLQARVLGEAGIALESLLKPR
ncbi:MAG: ribonuclease PH [Polyangiaceae bacterium]|nr:ribonuclease PH [Polyangiaceae bacterium]